MTRVFPWYDSLWLSSYVRAKELLRERHPGRLKDFVCAFDVLRTDPSFETIKIGDMISAEDHERLKALVEIEARLARDKHEVLRFGRLIVHDAPLCSELQARLTGRISDLVGEEVEPSYNFLSLYTNLGVCAVHLDAPSAKWTFDYCIEQSAPWPIYLSQVQPWPEEWRHDGSDWDAAIRLDPANRFTPYVLDEGEAIVFSGSSQLHYRDRIARTAARNFCHLVFLHYVPRGVRHLSDPEAWASHFGIEGLDDVIVRPAAVDQSRVG